MFSNSFTIAIIIGLVGSCLIYLFMYVIISSSLVTADIYNTMSASYAHIVFYVITALIVGATTLIDLGQTRWK